MNRLLFSCFAVFLAIAPVAHGSSSVEAASTCLRDSTSGRDRKDLAKWLFLAMSKHPEIRYLANASAEADEESNVLAGALITRLIADDCPIEISAMVAEHGASSVSLAFEVVGRVAMEELMAHPDVAAVFTGLDRYADQDRIARVVGGK